jgi:undecaprenyl-diphosphatase
MEKIIQIDTTISLYINQHYSDFADFMMVTFSSRTVWIPLYILFIYGAYRATAKGNNFWWRLLVTVASVFVAVGLADYISVHCFKNVFMRLRPCCEPLLEGVLRPYGQCHPNHLYGFVSSHAVNVFTLAAFLTPLLDRYRVVRYGGIYIWAILVGYSRIYLGYHYFGDVLCGALLGIIIGIAIYFLHVWINRKVSGLPRKS